MENWTIVIPPAIDTLGLFPVIQISVVPFRPAPIHTVDTQAIKIAPSTLSCLFDFRVPVDAAFETSSNWTHVEHLQPS